MILMLQAFANKCMKLGVAQVRFIPATGAEKFAEYIFDTSLNEFIKTETEGQSKSYQKLSLWSMEKMLPITSE